ncbi:hypothetical protein BDFB_011580 [Asbolus verrucosus]|uniref:RanBP2-type domain-containing protein n=1 Tax=Asbolus verrucosus TaxID=1661398 RepID=A0A482VTA5_ASBVE|nr:hypothetical protein BDFB_011580 [Asbolus verrucosus]
MSSQGPNRTNKSPNSTKTQVSTGTKPTPIVEKKEAKRNTIEDGKTTVSYFCTFEDQKFISAINCSKFSEPLCRKQCLDVIDNFKSADKNINSSIKIKNNGENIIKPAPQLETGSVMDVFRKTDASPLLNKGKPKSAESITWECETCLVKNSRDKVNCSACDGLNRKCN